MNVTAATNKIKRIDQYVRRCAAREWAGDFKSNAVDWVASFGMGTSPQLPTHGTKPERSSNRGSRAIFAPDKAKPDAAIATGIPRAPAFALSAERVRPTKTASRMASFAGIS